MTRSPLPGWKYPTRNEYDPQQFFAHSFGIFAGDPAPVVHVVLRLNKKWSTYALTHRWHTTQRITVRPAEVMVELDVRVCPELEAWILGFSEDAEVIEPAGLRDTIA